MRKGIVFVISGPAGSGKSTIVDLLCSMDGDIKRSVSMTTRKPRDGEVGNVSYLFVDKDEFEKRIAEGRVLEYAEYCGNYYGTPADYVRECTESGHDIVLTIETVGAANVKKMIPDCVRVFILPEKKELIRERLEARGTESAEVIEKRLRQAKVEIERASDYDYVIVNRTDRANDAAKELYEIMNAEHHRASRNSAFIDSFKD